MEKKILFVDDEKDILEMLECLFLAEGYLPRCTISGNEGLEILKKENVHVAFVDLRMPEMNGIELCRQIKQQDPSAYVYALSAYVGAITPEQYDEAGFTGYFRKPFDANEIVDAARDAFRKLGESEEQDKV